MAHKPTREEAWAILTEHVTTASLVSHALTVEAVMRHFARKSGAEEEPWGVIGLGHDVDCEEHTDEHLRHAPEILRSQGWPEEYVRAVASHGWGLFTDAAPVTDPEKTLFAIDELTGLFAAAVLVRPSRKRSASRGTRAGRTQHETPARPGLDLRVMRLVLQPCAPCRRIIHKSFHIRELRVPGSEKCRNLGVKKTPCFPNGC